MTASESLGYNYIYNYNEHAQMWQCVARDYYADLFSGNKNGHVVHGRTLEEAALKMVNKIEGTSGPETKLLVKNNVRVFYN